MTEAKLEYHRQWREANKAKVHESFKRWHEANGKAQYYNNLELTRAIKRKYYHKQAGNVDAMNAEQAIIDRIRLEQPRKSAGPKPVFSAGERLERRRATLRKSRYKHSIPEIKQLPLEKLISPKACEICGSEDKICMDHCHSTNKLRGWICDSCNVVLGRVKDDVGLLGRMIVYLDKHKGALQE